MANGNAKEIAATPAAAAPSHQGSSVCDLCGTAAAFVRCGSCSQQIFCLSCDDMYHRHPRRTTHVRKALSNTAASAAAAASSQQTVRPPLLPPKAKETVTPVAPPRKNLRKGSAPDSPVTMRQDRPMPNLTRSSTLPRKMGSMVGRPLPPPPPSNANKFQPPPPQLASSQPLSSVKTHAPVTGPAAPPPALPAKPAPSANPSMPFYPNDHNNLQSRKMSTSSQPPMHLQYPSQNAHANMTHHPNIPVPGYPMPMTNGIPFMDHTGTMRYPADMNFGNNTAAASAAAAAAAGGLGGWKPQPPNPYLEGVEFPTPNSGGHKNNKRMPPNQRSQFYRLNKSSSLHDIAMHEHEHPNSNGRMPSMHPESVGPSGGISWGDEPWNTTQSTMNQPTMNVHEMLDQQRHFGRASSTKSLHQTNEELWANNMWSPAAAANAAPGMPMSMNPMMFATGQMPMPTAMHRSMHELHNPNGHRAPSPTTSSKSKKSRDRFQNRANKAKQRNQSQQQTNHSNVAAPSTTPSTQEKQPTSRPHSRSHSKQRLQKEKTSHRGYRESSRTRQKRRSMSSEDNVDSEEVNQKSSRSDDLDYVDDDDEDASMKSKKKSGHRNKYDSSEDDDFFTGESDNDFVSLSSGSNSKRAPRKSWECQHCTYVNNPGVAVCAMCCRTTSKQPRSYGGPGDENERASSRSSMKNKKKSGHRSKYDSSEDEESEAAANRRHQKSSGGTGGSKTNSLKRGGGGGVGGGKQNGRKKHGKSPIPDVQAMHVSDPDDDGINEYYAVRHMDRYHSYIT